MTQVSRFFSDQQRDQFARDFDGRGFLKVEGAVSSEQVARFNSAGDRHRTAYPDHWIELSDSFCEGTNVLPDTDDFDEMIDVANGVMYGLTASIVTNDFSAAMRAAERVEAGYVWINSAGRYLGAPYGGWKQSGIGKEESFEELLSYTRVKNVNMRW